MPIGTDFDIHDLYLALGLVLLGLILCLGNWTTLLLADVLNCQDFYILILF